MGKSKIIMPLVLAPSLAPGPAAVACAHGALAGYLAWQDDAIVREWLSSTFFKRVYQAPDAQTWATVMKWSETMTLTESRLGNQPVIAVFNPMRWSNSNFFQNLPLYPANRIDFPRCQPDLA